MPVILRLTYSRTIIYLAKCLFDNIDFNSFDKSLYWM